MVMSKRWKVAIHMQVYCIQNIVGAAPNFDLLTRCPVLILEKS